MTSIDPALKYADNPNVIASATEADRLHGIPRSRTYKWAERGMVESVGTRGKRPTYWVKNLRRLNRDADRHRQSTTNDQYRALPT